jgi:hypothetical protein
LLPPKPGVHWTLEILRHFQAFFWLGFLLVAFFTGDHHIFTHEGVIEIINIQPKGSHAKPYQVRQVRNIILKYRLGGEND